MHILPKLAFVPVWPNSVKYTSKTILIELILVAHSLSYLKPLPANPDHNSLLQSTTLREML